VAFHGYNFPKVDDLSKHMDKILKSGVNGPICRGKRGMFAISVGMLPASPIAYYTGDSRSF